MTHKNHTWKDDIAFFLIGAGGLAVLLWSIIENIYMGEW